MELIDQHTKRIMEGCKERARDAGLRFSDETLEYIVTNRDLLELSPKVMIPTLYDYWVHDVEVLREKGKYELYPPNPYETVTNTRPVISFYNDNTPDWLNVMIFYHVLAHIDFFQNNLYFRHTWDYDFAGHALSDKRAIAKLRSEKGRWVDYIIEFSRAIDNLVGYHETLARYHRPRQTRKERRIDYYFDHFLQVLRKVSTTEYLKEIERFNQCRRDHDASGVESFFLEVEKKYPEFPALYHRFCEHPPAGREDLVQYLCTHSSVLNREENRWMQEVLQIVRQTALFFQPQIRTKIMNEGWASYWHETLFLKDERIRGHEVDFARVNAGVTALPRIGINPYALGMRLFYAIEEAADRGRLDFDYDRLTDARQREQYDRVTAEGRARIFAVRGSHCDFTFINRFLDQDFISQHRLFVAGRRLNPQKMVWEYYVKSRRAADYRQMILDSLYHPPHVTVAAETEPDKDLILIHHFEGKPLVTDYIPAVLLGLEYLWGHPVQIETSEPIFVAEGPPKAAQESPAPSGVTWRRVRYTMKERRMSKKTL